MSSQPRNKTLWYTTTLPTDFRSGFFLDKNALLIQSVSEFIFDIIQNIRKIYIDIRRNDNVLLLRIFYLILIFFLLNIVYKRVESDYKNLYLIRIKTD